MKAIKLEINGNWAQFRKAETNNNPLSHDLITKTAFIGLIGAVIGIERKVMRLQFPKLCDGLLYSVQINNEIVKQSWGFTLRNVNHCWEKSPKQMEFIKHPSYTVVLALNNDNCTSEFEQFLSFCRDGKACFTPVLGLHNCPAEVIYIDEGEIVEKDGVFETLGFLKENYVPQMEDLTDFRIGFDKIPTYQNDDFWNLPECFCKVVYPSNGSVIKTKGKYYEFKDESKWCLI